MAISSKRDFLCGSRLDFRSLNSSQGAAGEVDSGGLNTDTPRLLKVSLRK